MKGVTPEQRHKLAVDLVEAGLLLLLDLIREGDTATSLKARRTWNRFAEQLGENTMHEPVPKEA